MARAWPAAPAMVPEQMFRIWFRQQLENERRRREMLDMTALRVAEARKRVEHSLRVLGIRST